MKFSELPQETQDFLKLQQSLLHKKCINNAYHVLLYNEKGTRYFYARRMSVASNWASFGGGSYWKVSYGAIEFRATKNPIGELDYELCDGRTFGKSVNGTVIPKQLATKKEVIAIAQQIGIFNI